MALIVVIAVMAGFEADLKSRILGGQPQVILKRHGGAFTDYPKVLQEVEQIEGVEAATPFILSQIMLRAQRWGFRCGAAGNRPNIGRPGHEDPSAGEFARSGNRRSLPGSLQPLFPALFWGVNWPETSGLLKAMSSI